MEELFTVAGFISLLTLTGLEIVLGLDNIIFISILADKLPAHQKARARTLGLILALVVRVILLSFINYLAHLTEPLVQVLGMGFSGRDLILMGGGIFLLYKTSAELHEKVAMKDEVLKGNKKAKLGFNEAVIQIILIDIVFSFDSILTAVGLSGQLVIMITAVIISMIIMILSSGTISEFINQRPTIKVIALSFLLVIGFLLVLEGFHQEVPKGYMYFAMAYSLGVEFLNIRMRENEHKKNQSDSSSSS